MQKNAIFQPPVGVQIAAIRGLELSRRFDRGGIEKSELGSGEDRARLLSSGSPSSLASVRRMRSFFESHEKSYDPSARLADGGPTSATIDWLLWGGNEGRQWANKVLRGESMREASASPEGEGKVLNCEVAKVDANLGIVFGYAIVCKVGDEEYFDTQGDHIPEQAMLEATADFMKGDRIAKDMHQGDAVGQVVYGFPVTEDIAKSLGIASDRTGFVVGMRPDEDSLLEKYRTGEYTGFSIGGRRIEDTVVDG